jgi:hypothetical protein
MLIKELKRRTTSEASDSKVAACLYQFAVIIAEKSKDHARRIIKQLPEFDLHDEVHLAAVLRNMEQIIGEKALHSLSIYELFFLYASSYLHDVGMALPDWELKMVEAVEAENELINGSWKADFNTKGGGPITITRARQLVIQHARELYSDFETVKKWFFAPDTEELLVEHLSQTAVQYQVFRSGFTKKFNSFTGDELRQYVQFLRIDFIRQTHHLRTYHYVKSLGRHMTEEHMQPWGAAVAYDLAVICQAHGEPMSFVEKMKTDAQYVGAEMANLQFIASLLRISDIVHFSIDRAPSVLASEMQFLSDESFVHWAVKQQGVNYDIAVSGDIDKKTIKFRAYCTEPRYYYALHKYLDWVDEELVNYARVSRRWELAFGKQASERWSIPLADEVDRTGISYDAEKFVPVPGLSFSLDQKRILELLMGVQLYKDKYACLRELYQNSLDACKCMISLSNNKEKGRVVLWLESKDSGKETYLCCMDNGVGMTKDIIVNHLLRIGNSYYKSTAFERLRVSQENSFTPTSQFGIGILSCFMLGDRLDIVTKPMQEFSEDTAAIRCTVDGVHENFYYTSPDPVDLERIGRHGTIVRVRLNDPSLISCKNDGKLWFRHFAMRRVPVHDLTRYDDSLFCDWDCHIHNIITKFVGLPRSGVKVTVQLADGNSEPIERWDKLVTWQDLNILEADVDRLEKYCRTKGLGDYYNENSMQEQVKVYESTTEYEGITFSWLLKLPSHNQDASPNCGIRSAQCFGKTGLFVDGVLIENSKLRAEDSDLSWFCQSGHLDFTGEIRPVLSVDRTSITSWPEPIQKLSKKLLQKVVSSSVEIARAHFEEEMLSDDDPKALAAWDYLLNHFYICKAEFLDTLTKDERYAGVMLGDIAELTQNEKLTLREFLDTDKICLPRLGYHDLGQTAKMLFLGKCGNADRLSIDDSGLWVKGNGFAPLVVTSNSDRDFGWKEILLRCDDWTGKFLEFDLVTDFWPVIPLRLFGRLESDSRQTEKIDASERAIKIARMGNGISALGEQDSCLVHPRLGLYQKDDRSMFSRKKVQKNIIGRFDKASNNHWLYEINGHYIEKNKPRYILFVYISPRELNPEEEVSLKEFETSDPEYIQGVRNGWSLLFLGREHVNPIIRPGILPRRDMVSVTRRINPWVLRLIIPGYLQMQSV